jgi:hypothetical protein
MNANFKNQASAARSIALICAFVVTTSVFQFVASLAAPSGSDIATVAYAQAPATTVIR